MALCSFVFGMAVAIQTKAIGRNIMEASPSNEQRKPGSNQRLGTVYSHRAGLDPHVSQEGALVCLGLVTGGTRLE